MPLDISAAYVQAGDTQIELLCQHNSDPSAFRDMYGEGKEGLHHVAVYPDDHDRLVSSFQARGFAVATEIFIGEGLEASFIDTRDLSGHMLEVYRDNDSINMFYKLVAATARNWDGQLLIVDINELLD